MNPASQLITLLCRLEKAVVYFYGSPDYAALDELLNQEFQLVENDKIYSTSSSTFSDLTQFLFTIGW